METMQLTNQQTIKT